MTERSDRSRTAAAKSRKHDETEQQERPAIQQWAPSNTLELPPNTGEFRFRWIAEYVNGQHMSRTVSGALREGYQRVGIAELPDDFIVDEDERGDGYARVGGLILMRIPEVNARQREAYYARRSAEGLMGANALQGVAGKNAVHEDRGTRTLTGADASAALRNMSSH